MKKVMFLFVPLMLIILVAFAFHKKPAEQEYDRSKPPPWPEDLSPVLIYNAEFAKRFGLDPNKAIQLEPGIMAVALTFPKEYEYTFFPEEGDGSDLISKKSYTDQLTWNERNEIQNHAEIFPLLFPGKYNGYSLIETYRHHNCGVSLYLDSNNPKVQQIDLRPSRVWISEKVYTLLLYLDYMRVANHGHGVRITNKTRGMENLYLAPYEIGTFENFEEFDKHYRFANFLPGISFFSYNTGCWLSQRYPQGLSIWFEKKGGANYYGNSDEDGRDNIDNPPLRGPFHKEDFLEFKIPAQAMSSPTAIKAVKLTDDSLMPGV